MTIDEINSRSTTPSTQVCKTIQPSDEKEWGDTLASIDEATRFVGSHWTKILNETYKYDPRFLVLVEHQKIVAALPYVIVKSPFTGTRAISLPFFDICRAYTTKTEHIPKLHAALKREGECRGWDYIELRGNIHEDEGDTPSLSFYNHIVDLRSTPEEIFNKFAPSNRRAIRKALKEGVKIEYSQSFESVKGFYRLQCITRKRHGLPSQPFKFFENIYRTLIANEKGILVSAFVGQGKLVASAIYLEQGDTVHYKYGASNKEFQNSRCNNLIMWSAMKRYSEQGFKTMDLGRNSITNAGLRRYKLSWGSEEKTVHYLRYDLKKNVTIPMNDDVFGWHNYFFRRLPSPLLQMAGRLLYRHIA